MVDGNSLCCGDAAQAVESSHIAGASAQRVPVCNALTLIRGGPVRATPSRASSACLGLATTSSERCRFLFERLIGDSSRPLGPRKSLLARGPVQRTLVMARQSRALQLGATSRAVVLAAIHSRRVHGLQRSTHACTRSELCVVETAGRAD
jgi:hypothetical protein